MILKLYNTFLSVCFPPTCFICKRGTDPLCKKCVDSLTRTVDSPYIYIQAPFSFKDARVRSIIHAIKYYHRPDLIAPMVGKLLKTLPENYFTNKEMVLIPIPMRSFKRLVRGYNQATQIAYEITKATGIPTNTKLLIRHKKKINQVKTKNRNERLQNQKGAFTLNLTDDSLATKTIILVDDVTTTGATLQEARKVLISVGAKNVQAIALAH